MSCLTVFLYVCGLWRRRRKWQRHGHILVHARRVTVSRFCVFMIYLLGRDQSVCSWVPVWSGARCRLANPSALFLGCFCATDRE